MNFLQSVKFPLREVCSVRASTWGMSAMLVGLVIASFGTFAFAEPANQAAATPTPTPGPSCVVPPQGMVVRIDTPSPGAVISPGSNVLVQGVAYDTASTTGSGVDRVSVFLGARDAGGIFWGDATLGQPSPQLGGNLTTAGFSRLSPTIPNGSGSRDIFAYAHSAISGREAAASVSVFLGAAPTAVRGQVPTPVATPLPACTPTPAPSATPEPSPTPIPALVQATPTARPTVAAPANPPAPLAPVPAAPAPTAPAVPAAPAPPAAVPPPAAAAPPAAAPATQTTAPRGGGIPVSLGFLVFAAGAGVVGGGVALRWRERRRAYRK